MKTLTLFGLLLISGVALSQSKISGTVWMSDVEPSHTLVFRARPDTVVFDFGGIKTPIYQRRVEETKWMVWCNFRTPNNHPVKFTAIFK